MTLSRTSQTRRSKKSRLKGAFHYAADALHDYADAVAKVGVAATFATSGIVLTAGALLKTHPIVPSPLFLGTLGATITAYGLRTAGRLVSTATKSHTGRRFRRAFGKAAAYTMFVPALAVPAAVGGLVGVGAHHMLEPLILQELQNPNQGKPTKHPEPPKPKEGGDGMIQASDLIPRKPLTPKMSERLKSQAAKMADPVI